MAALAWPGLGCDDPPLPGRVFNLGMALSPDLGLIDGVLRYVGGTSGAVRALIRMITCNKQENKYEFTVAIATLAFLKKKLKTTTTAHSG